MGSRISTLYPPISRAFAAYQAHLPRTRYIAVRLRSSGTPPLKGDRLPPTHHVARHCRKNDLVIDPNTLAPSGVQECALVPDPDGLSSTWLEFFGGDRSHNLAGVRRVIGLTPKPSNRLAVLNVGRIETAGNAVGLHVIE